MNELSCDVAVIGGGAAGMAAAAEVAKRGFKPLILEREPHLGGILQQCIHTGFGLHRFKEELSGPEYAGRDITEIRKLNVDALCGTTVLGMSDEGGAKILEVCSKAEGASRITAKAIVLAMGSRERNRGNTGIPGTRPAGVMTAGLAQRLLNLEGCLTGKRAVIIGSGDIGLIMARRLTWTGAKVLAVVEILPYPSGLARNIAQCLDDYGIPLKLSHAVTRIAGTNRVERVEIAPLVDGAPDLSKADTIDCDTVLLSVGLIPENELSKTMGVSLSLATGGPVVDSALMTNVPGVFACGNVLHVHDLVDHVSDEATRCGAAVSAYLEVPETSTKRRREGAVAAGANLKYVSPSKYVPGSAQRFSMRVLAPMDGATLSATLGGEPIISKTLRFARPSEMITVDIPENRIPTSEKGEPPPLEFSVISGGPRI